MRNISQGEIISVENLSFPVLVVSKDFFNRSGQVIACPIIQRAETDPLHIPVETGGISGVVLCEQLKLLDMQVRGYKKISELSLESVMDITDAIRGIFDYYPVNQ